MCHGLKHITKVSTPRLNYETFVTAFYMHQIFGASVSYVPTPSSQESPLGLMALYFVWRSSPGKGMGLLAHTAIPKGQLIHDEKALFRVSNTKSAPIEICKAIRSLATEARNERGDYSHLSHVASLTTLYQHRDEVKDSKPTSQRRTHNS